jgi:TolA-binding protein
MKRLLLLINCLLLVFAALAQSSQYFITEQRRFNQAKDHYQREEFSLAYPLFKELKGEAKLADKSSRWLQDQEVDYYTTVCALKLNEGTAEQSAQEFIDLEHNIARRQMMSFHLAEYFFRQNKLTEAIPLYEQASIANLSNREIADMKFHQGYIYFTFQQFDKAKPLLDAIRQSPKDPNYADANYYYGFIVFRERKYTDALDCFSKVQDHPEYGKVVPFYITEIYYFKGQKDKAIEYGEALLKRGNQYYDIEMRQLVGHVYFEKGDYKKALPYLEAYVQQSEKVRREDLYELSYCYYQDAQFGKAIEGFKQLGGKEDSLGQNSMYLLGDAYLKRGEKANARTAFQFCAANSSNDVQREISKFNYGKLSYELGFQKLALDELKDFLELYPNSTYRNEAQELLVGALTNTNNYKDAEALLAKISNPSENTKRLFARIWYGRAMELLNDQQLDAADATLNKVLSDPYNKSVLSYTQFWKGEIAYRQNKIDDAIRYYQTYLNNSSSSGDVNATNARYNLGYALLKKENYKQAVGFFEMVTKTASIGSNTIEQDAYLRSADCYFMNREFARANAMYDNVLNSSWPSSDYALFQKSMIAGIKSSNDKISLLKTLDKRYPNSDLAADANMEIAGTLMADERFADAIPYLNYVLKSLNAVSLKPQAYLKLGVAYTNLNKNKEALDQFNRLVNEFPNSPEAEDAVDNVKEIYVDEGRAGEYAEFMRKAGKPLSVSQEDSLTYTAAERRLANADQDGALRGYTDYLDKFPNGTYALEANYYRSEIYTGRKDWNNAIGGYEYLAAKAPNKFAERALFSAARIHYFELKNYPKAEIYFTQLIANTRTQENKLEGMRGLLRSQYQQQKWSEAVENAKNLLAQKGASVDDKVLANMSIGRSFESNNQFDEAIPYYKTVVSLNKAALAAEARYGIASCLYRLNKPGEAEKAAFEVIKKSGSYDYWITKAYILLGDIYFSQKDYFNAKATFQSVVENTTNAELKAEAQQKLNLTLEEERKASKIENNG